MKDSYQNAKLYASFMGDKVKDILNHKITAKDGLVSLVAGAQLFTPSLFAQDKKTEMQPTYEINRQYDEQKIPEYVTSFIDQIKQRPSFLKLNKGSANDPLVLIRLTRDSPYFLVSGSEGNEINRFASTIGRKAIENSRKYQNFNTAFSSKDNKYINNWCQSLDRDKNKIIDISEQP